MQFEVITYPSVAMILFKDGEFIAVPQREEWSFLGAVNYVRICARLTKDGIIEFKAEL
jgi:hypothetical protein